jgi:hypothetical protein
MFSRPFEIVVNAGRVGDSPSLVTSSSLICRRDASGGFDFRVHHKKTTYSVERELGDLLRVLSGALKNTGNGDAGYGIDGGIAETLD